MVVEENKKSIFFVFKLNLLFFAKKLFLPTFLYFACTKNGNKGNKKYMDFLLISL